MSFIHKFVFTLLFSISAIVTGCVSIQLTSRDPVGLIDRSLCQPFVMPVLKPIPDVPILTEYEMGNRDLTDTVLVNKIKELRDYAKLIRKQMQEVNELHLESCR